MSGRKINDVRGEEAAAVSRDENVRGASSIGTHFYRSLWE